MRTLARHAGGDGFAPAHGGTDLRLIHWSENVQRFVWLYRYLKWFVRFMMITSLVSEVHRDIKYLTKQYTHCTHKIRWLFFVYTIDLVTNIESRLSTTLHGLQLDYVDALLL